MARMRLLPFAVLLVLAACDGGEPATPADAPAALDVTSSAFAGGEPIPVAHTCDGADEPPPLAWGSVPAGTVEVVVAVTDELPGRVFTHWLVAGLGPDETLAAGELPAGAVEGANDFGRPGYGGPCPPEGDEPHTYRFSVVALDAAAGLEPAFDAADFERAVDGHALATGTLEGTYGR